MWNALGPCLQAEKRRVLELDANRVRVAAQSVVDEYHRHVDYDREVAKREYVESVIDLYMMVEHNDFWQEVHARRKMSEDGDEIKLDELSADTMDEMVEKMRRAAGML